MQDEIVDRLPDFVYGIFFNFQCFVFNLNILSEVIKKNATKRGKQTMLHSDIHRLMDYTGNDYEKISILFFQALYSIYFTFSICGLLSKQVKWNGKK